MKKLGIGKTLLIVAASAIFFAGCTNSLDDPKDHVSGNSLNYGSLTTSVGSERAIDASEIKSAVVTVVGFDSNGAKFERTSGAVEVSGGKGNGIKINKIPVSKNCAVVVQAYGDASATKKINGLSIYARTDISAGNNGVEVSKFTSNEGLVYASLIEKGVNTNKLTSSQISSLTSATPSSDDVNFSLVNAASIASDFSASTLKAAANYVYSPVAVTVIPEDISGYSVQISDPNSSIAAMGTSNVDFQVTPGSWIVYAMDSNGTVVTTKSITVAEGSSPKVTVSKSSAADVSGKILVHVPASLGYKYCHSWSGDVAKATAWPGYEMVLNGDYYDVEITATKSLVIFNNNNGSQTADLSVTEGEWNYIGGEAGSADANYSAVTTNFSKVEKSESVDNVSISINYGDNPPASDVIKVHAKGYAGIYIWNSGNATLDKKSFEMTSEGNEWYAYTIEAASSSIIFQTSAGNWSGKTGDLSVKEAGEYWYYKGKFYDSNPEDSVAPECVSFTSDKSGKVSGSVTFTVTATDDKNLGKAVLIANGTETIGTIELKGTSATGSFVWDTTKIQNKTYKVTCTVSDAAGNAVAAANAISVTTSNANLPPVAMISGTKNAGKELEVTYSAANSYDQNGGTIASYKWSVTGATCNSTTAQKIKVKMPSAAGSTVTISLVVTDNDGASSEKASISVNVMDVDPTWDFRDETIYFLMTTRFYDGNTGNNEYCWDEGGEYLPFGSGDCAWRGDFKGLIDKLDYIKALGFSAIWITPVVVNSSGIDYHGYHAYDFSHVDPRYGSGIPKYDVNGDDISGDEAYQELIDAVHDKGMKVIQDIVLNHSGNFGEKNLFHMFDKETTPYENKDIPLPAGAIGKRSPFMKLAENGNAYDKLMSGLSMAGGSDYETSKGAIQYGARINAMKEDTIDTDFIYHHAKMIDWNSENCQLGQMAGDCVDLNTENPTVFNYLKDCYVKYINMGVDAFRIDTVKHISRLTFNKEFIPAFMEAGGDGFYIFGETCARYMGRWNEGVPALSPSFYTWKEDSDFAWSSTDHAANSASATAHFSTYRSGFDHPAWADGTANHLLKGNDYHTPDYSMRSHLDQIDFPMHWAFRDAPTAFNQAVNCNDGDFNDATWNVVYVDSHDYAPDNAPESARYSNVTEWPRNMNLMFTFRGIPCLYYGSEIAFMSGAPIDPANGRVAANKSGRAYYGDYLEGSVNATDFSEFTATGAVAETLNHDLAKHVTRLNQIRRAIPALRKGQYSTKDCNGAISFKRRYTNNGIDSFVLVAIGGQASFSGVPAGKYVEVVTGNTVSCDGSLTSDAIGQDNMRVYVLQTGDGVEPTGKIGETGAYLK